jgi:hypothetical protein
MKILCLIIVIVVFYKTYYVTEGYYTCTPTAVPYSDRASNKLSGNLNTTIRVTCNTGYETVKENKKTANWKCKKDDTKQKLAYNWAGPDNTSYATATVGYKNKGCGGDSLYVCKKANGTLLTSSDRATSECENIPWVTTRNGKKNDYGHCPLVSGASFDITKALDTCEKTPGCAGITNYSRSSNPQICFRKVINSTWNTNADCYKKGSQKSISFLPEKSGNTCQKITCPKKTIANSKKTISIPSGKYGDEKTVTCKTGYEGGGVWKCGANKKYSFKSGQGTGKTEDCKKTCKERVVNNSVNSKKLKGVIGDKIEITCKSNYGIKQDSKNNIINKTMWQCDSNGDWSGAECKKICKEKAINNSNKDNSNKLKGFSGDKIEITCKPNYGIEQDSNNNIIKKNMWQCNSNGEWRGAECKNTCTTTIKNSTAGTYTGISGGDSIKFTCKDGYDAYPSTIKCQTNGKFTKAECVLLPKTTRTKMELEKILKDLSFSNIKIIMDKIKNIWDIKI